MAEFISVWHYDLLFSKAKFYIQKAFAEERESSMFPFWSALSLEFLGRSTLAYIHPVLLADPQEGKNILYVFGYTKEQKFTPKSVPAKTVFSRCKDVIPTFTDTENNFCLSLIEKRNEELHSGSNAFDNYHTSIWLSGYYKVCKILLNFTGNDLSDLLGESEAEAAEEMIIENNKELIKDILNKISSYKKVYDELTEEDRIDKVELGVLTARASDIPNKKLVKCISCNNISVVSGKLVSTSDAKLLDGNIVEDSVLLPTQFVCFCCGLKLNKHSELSAAGFGGQYVIKVIYDPIDFHGFDEEPDFDSYMGDYAND